MAEDKITLAEVDINANPAIAKLAELQKEIDKTTANKKSLKENNKGLTDEFQAESLKLQDLKKQYSDTQKVAKAYNILQKKEIGTVAEARKALAALNVQWANSTKLYGENSTKSKELTQRLSETRGRLKELEGQAGNTSVFVGGYKDAIMQATGAMGMVSPAASGAISAIKNMGSALAVLAISPVVLTITAIVAGLALLVKWFKSTDTGATKLAGVFKSLGNVAEVLLDWVGEVVEVYKDLWTFKWKELGGDIKDVFIGAGDAIRDAAKAGMDYADTMDRIADGMAADQVGMAQMRQEIERLTTLSKDRTKSEEERLAAAQRAMDLELELNRKEVEWKKQATEAELANLAAKLDNAKMTDEAKRQQVDNWIKYNAEEAEAAKQNDAALAEFYNNNEEAFQNLQKLYAEDIDKQTEYYSNTRRLVSSISSLKEEISNEEAARQKAANDAALKELEAHNNEEAARQKEADDAALKELEAHNKAVEQELKDQVALKKALAGDDLEAMKEALLAEYQLQISNIELTNTQKQLLMVNYDKAITEIEAEQARRRLEQQEITAEEERALQEELLIRRQEQAGENLDLQEQILDEEYNKMLQSADYQKLAYSKQLQIEREYNKAKKQLSQERRSRLNNELGYVSDAMGAISDVFGKNTVASKAFAIAQATINAFLAGSQVMADPTLPFYAKIAGMVAVVATGLANVAAIAKVDTSGSTTSAEPPAPSRSTAVISTASTTSESSNLYSGIVSTGATNKATEQTATQASMSNAIAQQQTVLVYEDYQVVDKRVKRTSVQANL